MLKHNDLVTVVKIVGKRAQITIPLQGWVSLWAGSASKPIIEPTAKKEEPKAPRERGQNRGPKKVKWSRYGVKKCLIDTR